MTKLSGFMNDSGWQFPLSSYHDLVEFQVAASNVNLHQVDSVGWDNIDVVGISTIWRMLQPQNQLVGWHNVFWFPLQLQVPRFGFYSLVGF